MKNKKIMLLVLILFSIAFVGCNSQSINATDTIEVKTIFDSYEEAEKPVDEAERLLKEYSPEYYLRDYTEVKERLNKEAQEFFTELFYEKYETYEKKEDIEGYINDDLRILTDVFLYNKSFYEAEQNNLSFKDIWNNKEEHLKYVNVYFISFKKMDIQDVDEDIRFQTYYWFVNGIVSTEEIIYFHEIVSVYDRRVLLSINQDELVLNNDMYKITRHLEEKSKDYQYYVKSKESNIYQNYGADLGANYIAQGLSEKYNLDFRPAFFSVSKDVSLYHPVINPEVVFSFAEDKFKSAYYQNILSDYVNEILRNNEIDNQVGQFSYVHTNDSTSINMSIYNDDYKDLVKENFKNVEVALYLLKYPNEDVDYQKIISSIAEIQELFDLESDNRAMLSVYLYVYQIDDFDTRKVLIDLFKVYRSSENYQRDENGVETWANNMYVVRNDTDCFKYLDLVRDDTQIIYNISNKIGRTHDVNVFLEKYVVETKFD